MDQKWMKRIEPFLPYQGRIIGTVVGVFTGFIFLLVGFWKTLFFLILVGIGLGIGYQLDRKEDMRQMLDKIVFDRWMKK